MSAFYDCGGGGCFYGDCEVSLYDNKVKKVREICKGDVLSNGAKVECVVKIKGSVEVLLLTGGLLITRNHPIKVNGNWKRPY